MNFGFFRGVSRIRVGTVMLFVALAVTTQSCGPSPRTEAPAVPKGIDRSKVLTEDKLYRYQGEGNEKRKVSISRGEKRKLINEAIKKAE